MISQLYINAQFFSGKLELITFTPCGLNIRGVTSLLIRQT